MKVLVCGSRNWTADNIICGFLTGVYAEYEVGHLVAYMAEFVLIEGGAKGADATAAWWADYSPMHSHNEHPDHPKFEHKQFPAAWQDHHPDWCPGSWCRSRSYCVGAGPRRNQGMLDATKPDIVLAFKDRFDWTFSKGGTEDMVNRAKQAGVTCYVISRA